MDKEEKKAIEELKEFIKGPCEICKFCKGAYKLNRKNIVQLLNLIEKLQKENKELHKEIERMKSLDIYKLVEDWKTGQLILIQKAKDKIEKYKNMCISNVKGYENYFKDDYNEFVFRRLEQLEKELIEESKED